MIAIGIPNWILLLNGYVSYKMISTKCKQIAFLLKEPVFNVQDVDIIYVVSLSTTFFYALLQYLFVLTHVNMPFIIAA